MKETARKGETYDGDFLSRITFELRSEEGDLYHTIPSLKAALPQNAVRLITSLREDSILDLLVQTDFQYPRNVLTLIVKTGIRNGRLTHSLGGDFLAERKLNTLYALNDFFEYKDEHGDGLRFYSDDCFSYEVKNNGDAHLTLLRSVQILSHGDAGPLRPCPKALELGEHRFRILLSPTGKKRFF